MRIQWREGETKRERMNRILWRKEREADSMDAHVLRRKGHKKMQLFAEKLQ